MRGEILSDSPREGQLACGEIHVFHDAHQFRDVECFRRYVSLLQSWSMLPDAQCCMSAFLPFAMHLVTLASGFNMESSSSRNPQRTLLVTAIFAAAAVVGWPFDPALSIPLVVEGLFLYAGVIVPASYKEIRMVKRWIRLARSVAVAVLAFGLAQRVHSGFPDIPSHLHSLQPDRLLR